ncbi:MAG: hypothetical protein JWP63_6432 [Candidatus Solibacter sp.]|jgi:hypothetical protein|nr:hypothetical protein [Candidatus Solibacter sp.]
MYRLCGAAAGLSRLAALLACAAVAPPVVILDKPVTITVDVPEPVRRANHILLQLEQVTTPRKTSATWNMFVELPDAGERSPVDLPNFAGYVTTLPNPSAATNPPKGMSLQLPDPAARLVRKLHSVRLTFVPVTKLTESVRIGVVRLVPID